MKKLKGLAWILIAVFLGLALARGVGLIATHLPWSFEQRIAKSIQIFPETSACRQSVSQRAAFIKIVSRLYPIYPDDDSFPLEIRVVHRVEVNAYASLGGQIYLNDSLIAGTTSAEELGGVLAHEIEHVKRRHVMEGTFVKLITSGALIFAGAPSPELASYILNLRFSREQERDADLGGLERLSHARVDIHGFQRFFDRLEASRDIPAIISDHPSNGERSKLVAKFLQTTPVTPILNGEEWGDVKKICR